MGIKTIVAAKSILRNIEDKIENYDTGLIGNKKITVREYYPLFVKDKLNAKAWNKTSKQAYDSIFTNHILPIYGDTNIIKIDRISYQEFINNKLNIDKLSYESVRSINNSFMALLNHAVDIGVIERNRLKRININPGEYAVRKKKHLTIEEYQSFMEVAEKVITDKYKYTMIYLTTFGLRRGEIMGLTSRHISFKNGLAWLEIQRTRTQKYPDGKGPKTPSSERTIVIDELGSELIKYTLNEAAEIKKDYGEILHQDDFIFIDQATGEPFHIAYLNVLMERVSIASGIKCSPHMMRHTFATMARIEDTNPRLLADFLGHKTTAMTDKYSHKTAEGMEKIVNLSNRRLD